MMHAHFLLGGNIVQADLSQPLPIAQPLRFDEEDPNCFYAPFAQAEPLRAGNFVGAVSAGAPVNFLNLRLNPHGNGTHTECVGHISEAPVRLIDCLRQYMYPALLLSIYPEQQPDGDRLITREALQRAAEGQVLPAALVLRTLPNDEGKRRRHYSGTNPPYIHHEAIEWMVGQGITHLLVDLPSVDREEDGGALLAHRAFWQYPDAIRERATITELIFVPDSIKDGHYLVQIQIAPFCIDASPSNPVLYPLL